MGAGSIPTCAEKILNLNGPRSENRQWEDMCPIGYNEFDFFLENKEYRPFDGCKIEI
jgi:hypothetical protein